MPWPTNETSRQSPGHHIGTGHSELEPTGPASSTRTNVAWSTPRASHSARTSLMATVEAAIQALTASLTALPSTPVPTWSKTSQDRRAADAPAQGRPQGRQPARQACPAERERCFPRPVRRGTQRRDHEPARPGRRRSVALPCSPAPRRHRRRAGRRGTHSSATSRRSASGAGAVMRWR